MNGQHKLKVCFFVLTRKNNKNEVLNVHSVYSQLSRMLLLHFEWYHHHSLNHKWVEYDRKKTTYMLGGIEDGTEVCVYLEWWTLEMLMKYISVSESPGKFSSSDYIPKSEDTFHGKIKDSSIYVNVHSHIY